MVGKCSFCGGAVADIDEAIQHTESCKKIPRQLKRRIMRERQKLDQKHRRCQVCGVQCTPATYPRCQRHIDTVIPAQLSDIQQFLIQQNIPAQVLSGDKK